MMRSWCHTLYEVSVAWILNSLNRNWHTQTRHTKIKAPLRLSQFFISVNYSYTVTRHTTWSRPQFNYVKRLIKKYHVRLKYIFFKNFPPFYSNVHDFSIHRTDEFQIFQIFFESHLNRGFSQRFLYIKKNNLRLWERHVWSMRYIYARENTRVETPRIKRKIKRRSTFFFSSHQRLKITKFLPTIFLMFI